MVLSTSKLTYVCSEGGHCNNYYHMDRKGEKVYSVLNNHANVTFCISGDLHQVYITGWT